MSINLTFKFLIYLFITFTSKSRKKFIINCYKKHPCFLDYMHEITYACNLACFHAGPGLLISKIKNFEGSKLIEQTYEHIFKFIRNFQHF